MKIDTLDARSRRMLDLLSEGASIRTVAQEMGYSEGTMRVYLHNLYKAIGVRNKTEAVIWYLNKAVPPKAVQASPAPALAPAAAVRAEESFGDMALREGLYVALGVMSSFLGPYGRTWEAATRLKGEEADAKTAARAVQARQLWRALLQGDSAYAKALHDEGVSERLLYESPSEAMLVAALLLIGGYSSAAEGLMSQLSGRRKSAPGFSAREASLLASLRDVLYASDGASLPALYQQANENSRGPVLKQVAMVLLYHAYRVRKDLDRARRSAEALWAEAEATRLQLEAMGVRPLAREVAVPSPTARAPGTRETSRTRDKVTAR